MGSLGREEFERIAYPSVRREDSVIDMYHGVPVSDPYRWYSSAVSSELHVEIVFQVERIF
jgi:prolyl oligopeptidase